MPMLANRYWALERTLEEYQDRQKEIDRIIRDNGGRMSGVAQALKKMFSFSGHTLTMPDPGKKNGRRFVGFIKFETRGVVVERYPEDTPSGEREEVLFTWTDVAKAMIDHAKGEKAEAEAFENRPSKSQALGRNNKNVKQEEKTMTMLAEKKVTGALTLADYEARIHLYREQIGTGYIGIGRTLNEAKEAGVVPHGEWEDWVTRTTGLNTRQAQRCMQAAREIRDGSALARLEMTKALLLLSSGLDEDQKEAVAKQAAEEGQSVRELREEIRRLKDAAETERADSGQVIRQLKQKIVEESGASAEIRSQLRQAKAERDQLTGQLEAAQTAYRKRMDEIEEEAYRRGMRDRDASAEESARKEFQGKLEFINGQRKQAEEKIRSLETELGIARNEGSTRWDEGYRAAQTEIAGIRNEMNKQKQYAEELKAELDAAEERERARAAEMAEMKRAKARSGMDAARGIGAQGIGAMDLSAAVRDFIGRAGVLPQMGEMMREMSERERGAILAHIETVGKWVNDSLAAMGVVRADARIQ